MRALQRYLRRYPAASLCVGLTRGGAHQLQLLRGAGAPPPVDSLYALHALTQVFTGALLALQVERGELRLDTPLSELLPRALLPDAEAGRITLLQLATHSAGLPYLPPNLGALNRDDPLGGYTALHFGELLRGLHPPQPLPRPYAESLLGLGLLGHALGRRAGLNYAHALRDLLFRPLGMGESSARVTDEQQPRLLAGHLPGGRSVPAWGFPSLPGAGALYSTGADLLRFLDANLGRGPEPVLTRALQRTHAPQARAGHRTVGLGWLRTETRGGALLWRASALGGYAGFLGLSPERDVGVVLLSDHGAAGLDRLLRRQPLEAAGLALLQESGAGG